MTHYIAAADSGTTGAKAVIYDLAGEPMAAAYREYGLIFPKPGWVDQDANMLRDVCFEVIREAVTKSAIDPAEIVAVCLSTQRCTMVPVDEAGNALREAISWQDNRTDAQCEEIRAKIGGDEFYDRTGLPVANVWTLPKIMWLREHEPTLYAKAHKFVNVQAYLNRALGAEGFVDDYSNVSLHGLMSLTDLEWIDAYIQALGLDAAKLPRLVGSGEKVGNVSSNGAAATGLLAGTPIISGAGDQQCAAVGCNVLKEGDCEVTLGTAGVAICSLDRPNLDPDRTMPCLVHALAGKYTCEGLQNAAGASFKWLRNVLQEAQDGSEVDYDHLTGLAASSVRGANGLLFLPYLAGAAAPLWDGSARGNLFGMSLANGLADVSRAVLEGISFETAMILENFARRGINIEKVRASGGGAKSEFWGQLQADIYGLPVQRLKVDDATILGAAILGAAGAGAYGSVEEAADAMVHAISEYVPDKSASCEYGHIRKRFTSLYVSLKDGGMF